MANQNPDIPSAPSRSSTVVTRLTRTGRGGRAIIFYTLALLLNGIGSLLFADLLWRFGWSPSKTVALVLFSILFMIASIGCLHGVYGFFLRRFDGEPRITSPEDYHNQTIEGTATALIFPMHNESVQRVYEGLRATYESIAKTGEIDRFDFFILSDSTDPDKWIEEEQRWFDLVRELDALGHIYYRHRPHPENKKSGNIHDFLSVWGKRYRYFIVFDADSVMRGKLVVDLVRLMETRPTAGLIQTATATFGARSPFARMQQFANRLYGPVFFPALNYWAQEGGNYWGHNAIIRTEPFIQYCDLPKLPGKKPFGGQILSHDFIEAALMRKENWEVWFAWDMEGSYEETPPGMIEHAQRDRRWCEGNLQHIMLLFARGLRGISRIHLTFGILAYLAGPLWLCFLLTGTYMLWFRKETGLSDVAVAAFTPFIHMRAATHALLVFGLSMFVLLLPKFLSLLDLALDPPRRRAFGGLLRASISAFFETLFSALYAPLQMLFHTRFVIATILGSNVQWGLQNRSHDGSGWSTAARAHWWQTLIGIGWGALVWWLDPASFWWFFPVLIGMWLSIPLSVFSSRVTLGTALRRSGLFLTPEEIAPPPELASLEGRLAADDATVKPEPPLAGNGLRSAVVNPYMNAIHVSLLMEQRLNVPPSHDSRAEDFDSAGLRSIGEKLLTAGPAPLSVKEQTALLLNPEIMLWLHREAWMRPDGISENDGASRWFLSPRI